MENGRWNSRKIRSFFNGTDVDFRRCLDYNSDVEERRRRIVTPMNKVEKKEKPVEKEILHPVMEAIKLDAKKNPDKYVKDYKIPAEGE